MFRTTLPHRTHLWSGRALLMLAGMLASAVSVAEDALQDQTPSSPVMWNWELDPYYSDVSVELPLSARPIPDGGAMRESEVYRTLFRESLHPHILMLEASVYPLPAFGAWMRGNHPDTYDNFEIGQVGENTLNVLEGLTAGFQEPWAMSAFVGSEMTFTRTEDRKRRQNRGYMGYLVSFGKKHIHNNFLIDDDWWEFEWKLKGEREFREEKLSWSFRAGVKNHGNPDIRDVVYLAFRRNNLDFHAPLVSFLRNSNIELMTEVARDDGHFLRQEMIVGKKLPIRRWHVAMELDVGLIYEDDAKYSGRLADQPADPWTLVFRPNIDW